MQNKKFIWVLIVLVVIAGFVFLTVKKRTPVSSPDTEKKVETNENNNQISTENSMEGVKITILKEGTGEAAKSGDNVAVNYTGSLVDGTVFDSSVDPKFGHVKPFVFPLGAGQVIKGWDVGVVGMKVGEKRKLEIAPEMAYGERSVGGIIGPNSTLIFEVELLGIAK